MDELKILSKEYRKINKEVDKYLNAYEKEKKKSECGFCLLLKQEILSFKPGDKLHKHCAKCPKSKNVLKAYNDINNFYEKIDSFNIRYAKKIYESLSEIKPTLVDTKKKELVEWTDLFGRAFEENIENRHYVFLIGLYEDNMSNYKIRK